MILPQLWEGEKSRLSDILSQRVLEYAGQPCEQLLDLDFPLFLEAGVVAFVTTEVEKEGLLRLDKKRVETNREVEGLYRRLLYAMALQKSLSSEELSELTTRSIELQFDCLVRPRQTLFERLYNNAEQLPKQDVLTVVSAFGEERPFILRLVTEVEKLDSETLLQVDFVSLATDCERAVYKSSPVSAFLTEVDLLLRFEENVTGESQFVLRSDILLGLLKERGMSGMAQAIEEEAKGKEFWTPDEIENAMDRVILVGHFMDEPEETGEVAEVKSAPLPAVSEEAGDDSEEGLDFRLPDTISIEDIDFVKKVQAKREHGGETSQLALNIRFAETDNSGEDEADLQEEPFQEKQEEVREAETVIHVPDTGETGDSESPRKKPPSDIPSFTTIISEEDREALLEKLFRDNRDEYDRFVETLDGASDWKDAKHIIERELNKRNVDPRSEEAVLLGDLAFARYYSDS